MKKINLLEKISYFLIYLLGFIISLIMVFVLLNYWNFFYGYLIGSIFVFFQIFFVFLNNKYISKNIFIKKNDLNNKYNKIFLPLAHALKFFPTITYLLAIILFLNSNTFLNDKYISLISVIQLNLILIFSIFFKLKRNKCIILTL